MRRLEGRDCRLSHATAMVTIPLSSAYSIKHAFKLPKGPQSGYTIMTTITNRPYVCITLTNQTQNIILTLTIALLLNSTHQEASN